MKDFLVLVMIFSACLKIFPFEEVRKSAVGSKSEHKMRVMFAIAKCGS